MAGRHECCRVDRGRTGESAGQRGADCTAAATDRRHAARVESAQGPTTTDAAKGETGAAGRRGSTDQGTGGTTDCGGENVAGQSPVDLHAGWPELHLVREPLALRYWRLLVHAEHHARYAAPRQRCECAACPIGVLGT